MKTLISYEIIFKFSNNFKNILFYIHMDDIRPCLQITHSKFVDSTYTSMHIHNHILSSILCVILLVR